MKFGEKLKELRCEMDISQQQLADMIFVTRQAVTKWEAGYGKPTPDNLKLLSQIFGVTIDYLMDDEASSPSSNAEVQDKAATKAETKPEPEAEPTGSRIFWTKARVLIAVVAVAAILGALALAAALQNDSNYTFDELEATQADAEADVYFDFEW